MSTSLVYGTRSSFEVKKAGKKNAAKGAKKVKPPSTKAKSKAPGKKAPGKKTPAFLMGQGKGAAPMAAPAPPKKTKKKK